MSQDRHKYDSKDFSLVLGGPLYQLYMRTFLLTPPLNHYKTRIIFISLLTWLPLLILSSISGTAFSGVKVPFFYDIEIHVRFLGSLALMIAAELVVHQRIQVIVKEFIDRNIIATQDLHKFNAIINKAMHLRNSYIVEICLIILVFGFGKWIWKEYMTLNVATWFAIPKSGQLHLTLPGYWYAFVSLPIFQFILLRWYFRLFIWYDFLWKTSKLPLHLNSLHPDRAGGLSFITDSIFALAPLLLAHTLLLAGLIANRILHAGAALPDFKYEIIGIIVFLLVIVLIPLFFFIFPLEETKRRGTIKYGAIASHYVNDFSKKWLSDHSEKSKMLLGSSDIQSLADLANSYQVTQEMRILPFTLRNIIQFIFIISIPFFPLALFIFKIEDIIGLVFKFFM